MLASLLNLGVCVCVCANIANNTVKAWAMIIGCTGICHEQLKLHSLICFGSSPNPTKPLFDLTFEKIKDKKNSPSLCLTSR